MGRRERKGAGMAGMDSSDQRLELVSEIIIIFAAKNGKK